MVEPDIYLLQLADGVRDALINAGFSTIKSILECTTSDLSNKIGVDQYIAQIIFEEAKKIRDVVTADTATTVNKDSDSQNNDYLLSIQ